jgi:hypothetical protein
MANYLEFTNPTDTTDTHVWLYSDTASTGAFTSAVATIATTTGSVQNTTTYTHVAGTSANWYKIKYGTSATTTTSWIGDTLQGGTSRLYNILRRRLNDTDTTTYEFSDDLIWDCITETILDHAELIKNERVDKSLTTTDDTYEYTLPSYVENIFKIKLFSGTDSCGEVKNYIQVGRTLELKHSIGAGYTMWVYYQKKPRDESDVDEKYDGLLILGAMLKVLDRQIQKRARFSQWGVQAKTDDTSVSELIGMKNSIQNEYDRLYRRFSFGGRPFSTGR